MLQAYSVAVHDTIGYLKKNEETFFIDTNDESTRRYIRILNIAGYIPVVGLISGIARVVLLLSGKIQLKHEDEMVRLEYLGGFKIAFITRGVIEALGLGFLYMGPDYVFNKVRSHEGTPRFE